jgi:hypothetical protein
MPARASSGVICDSGAGASGESALHPATPFLIFPKRAVNHRAVTRMKLLPRHDLAPRRCSGPSDLRAWTTIARSTVEGWLSFASCFVSRRPGAPCAKAAFDVGATVGDHDHFQKGSERDTHGDRRTLHLS